jgi:hypothetical protein
MKKISIFLPSIRTFYLYEFYKTIEKSCQKNSFEVVVASPFDLPPELQNKENVKLIKTYSHPTKAAHLAALACEGELIYHTTDDVLFLENSIDEAIDLYERKCSPKDIVSMRYIESVNHEDKSRYPDSYWTVANGWAVPTLNTSWNINAHFLMSRNLFLEFGGFDCCFEYLTHAAGDLLIRLQKNGSVVYHSTSNICTADWSGGSKGEEHMPIEIAQVQLDTPLFWRIWSTNYNTRNKININNHLSYPEKWERRFGKRNPISYNELSQNV